MVWPYETSKVGTAMINLLQTYPPQPTVRRGHFDRLLRQKIAKPSLELSAHAQGLLQAVTGLLARPPLEQ